MTQGSNEFHSQPENSDTFQRVVLYEPPLFAKVINTIDEGMFTIYDRTLDEKDEIVFLDAADDNENLKKFKFKL